jgi:hypothetical protein
VKETEANNQTMSTLENQANLTGKQSMGKRSQSMVFNRLFMDSKKLQNLRDEKARQYNEKQFSGLFTPSINTSQTDLVTRGRLRVSLAHKSFKSQEKLEECTTGRDVFDILSQDATRRSRLRSLSQSRTDGANKATSKRRRRQLPNSKCILRNSMVTEFTKKIVDLAKIYNVRYDNS